MKRMLILIMLSFFNPIFAHQKLMDVNQKNYQLDYFYDVNDDILHIFKIDDNERIEYLRVDNTSWGMYQISADKKKLIYFEETYSNLNPLVFIDVDKDLVKKYRKVPLGSMMDANGNYLLFQTDSNFNFELMDLNTGELTKNYEIKLKNMNNGLFEDFTILRSADNPEYDFLLIYGHERLVSAKIYLNVKTDEIYKEFDDSDKNENEMRSFDNYGFEFTGLK